MQNLEEPRDELRLLLVEDDEAYQEVLSRSLTRRGFTVTTASNPEEALGVATQHDPEYIILDLNLAGQSGLNLIRPLLDISPGARLVVLTGYASIPTAVGAVKLGASQYLTKPAEVREIIKALQDNSIEIPEMPTDELLSVQNLEWEYIHRVLAEHDGNITATARALKMHRRTLQRKLAKKRPA
jgi:two-component system response regulator RegA